MVLQLATRTWKRRRPQQHHQHHHDHHHQQQGQQQAATLLLLVKALQERGGQKPVLPPLPRAPPPVVLPRVPPTTTQEPDAGPSEADRRGKKFDGAPKHRRSHQSSQRPPGHRHRDNRDRRSSDNDSDTPSRARRSRSKDCGSSHRGRTGHQGVRDRCREKEDKDAPPPTEEDGRRRSTSGSSDKPHVRRVRPPRPRPRQRPRRTKPVRGARHSSPARWSSGRSRRPRQRQRQVERRWGRSTGRRTWSPSSSSQALSRDRRRELSPALSRYAAGTARFVHAIPSPSSVSGPGRSNVDRRVVSEPDRWSSSSLFTTTVPAPDVASRSFCCSSSAGGDGSRINRGRSAAARLRTTTRHAKPTKRRRCRSVPSSTTGASGAFRVTGHVAESGAAGIQDRNMLRLEPSDPEREEVPPSTPRGVYRMSARRRRPRKTPIRSTSSQCGGSGRIGGTSAGRERE